MFGWFNGYGCGLNTANVINQSINQSKRRFL